MAAIKSYTDLKQSRKLKDILPLESADMYYEYTEKEPEYKVYVGGNIAITYNLFSYRNGHTIPCWSLAALIEVLPLIEGFKPVIDLDINQILYEGKYRDELNVNSENLIDACYEMIIRLNELNLL